MDKLKELAGFTSRTRASLMFIGDWNMEPHELEASGFLQACTPGHRMDIVLPDAAITCTAGHGRILDYAVGDVQSEAQSRRSRLQTRLGARMLGYASV